MVVTRTEEDENEEGEEVEWRSVDFNVRWNSGLRGVNPPPTREGGREEEREEGVSAGLGWELGRE